MTRSELLAGMQKRLETAGIPFESVKVFGAIRCNVHVVCLGKDTANKWAILLGQVFRGSKVYVGDHEWRAVGNKGTVLRPTKRKGYIIAVSG